MKETEDLLREAPRTPPSEALDRNMAALFRAARQRSTSRDWMTDVVPAWAAGLACLACLATGLALAPRRTVEAAPTPTESRPAVYIKIASTASGQADSPFIRVKSPSKNRVTSQWTITP